MKREDFIQIIKLRSHWGIDKRRGNYALPNGERLSRYIKDLVESQMKVDNLVIRVNGDLCVCSGGGDWNNKEKRFNDYVLNPDFEDKEICSFDNMEKRINRLVNDIIG